MVCGHIVDDHLATQPLAGGQHHLAGAHRLRLRRHQRTPVQVGPAVELDGRHLDAAATQPLGQIDHLGQVVQILAMHHGVQRQRKADGEDPFRRLHLATETATIAADPVGHLGIDALQGQLDMIDHPVKLAQARFGQPDARGDQIDIKPRIARRGGDLRQVAPRGGLAARQMHLQDAHLGGLTKGIGPFRRRQLALHPRQLDRVRAIGTGQRTAMRQLGQHRHWRCDPDRIAPDVARTIIRHGSPPPRRGTLGRHGPPPRPETPCGDRPSR